jgi:Septum formation
VRLLGLLLTAVLAASALTGCSRSTSQPRADPTRVVSSSTPTPTVTVTPKPKPSPPPPARACYRVGYDEVLAPTLSRKPAPCDNRRTAVGFYVGSFDRKLAVDGAQVHRLESTVCPRRFAAFVGGTPDTRRLSLLRTVWFTPTVEDAALGAHWFQCVAIALRGDGQLALLTGRIEGVLDRPDGRAHYGLCGTAQPGTAGFEQRICADQHSWKALRTVDFRAGPYPGEDEVRSAGQGPCRDAGRAAASNPLDYQWSYQWPTATQWRNGQTYGVCWAPG